MKRILITGVNGYIGSSFAEYLKQWPESYAADKISLWDDAWKNADFSGYDAILHAAGLAHINETKENAHLYYEINRDLTEAVAVKAKAEGVGQFIFLSSMSVYGLDEGVITPDTVPAPKTNYGKSKLQAEEKLQALHDDSFKVTLIRPPMVYGPGCPGNFQTLSRLAVGLPVFPRVNNRRSMLYVDRLSQQLCRCVEQGVDGVCCPQDPDLVNTAELAKLLAQAQGSRLHLSTLLGALLPLGWWMRAVRKAFGSLWYDASLQTGAPLLPELSLRETVERSIQGERT